MSLNRRTFLKQTAWASLGTGILAAASPAALTQAASLQQHPLLATTGNLKCLKVFNTGSNSLEAHTLSAASNYQQFTLHTGTPLTADDAALNFRFGIGADRDIVGIKTINTGSGTMEVHTLSAASNYQSFSLHTATPIAQSDAFNHFHTAFMPGTFLTAANGDLITLKTNNTGTGTLEVHILSAASNYQQFTLHTGTPITQDDAFNNFFFTANDRDVVGIKVANTGTGTMEVHILSAASNYQQFTLHTGTPILQSDAANNFFGFVMTNNNLLCVKRNNTGTGTMEVHILSAASNYQRFILQTGTPITQSDALNFVFSDANS